MDVERLMRDLTIEQLENIQTSLSKEVDTKKEELRQMVGRRYRVVLQAANAVNHLAEISNELVKHLQSIQDAVGNVAMDKGAQLDWSIAKKKVAQQFILLHTVIALVGNSGDGLTDVFCLLLAESLYRNVIVNSNVLLEVSQLTEIYADQLIGARLRLKDYLLSTLGELTEWSSVAAHLVALAFLNQHNVEELLNLYMDAKHQTVLNNVRSSTLIGVIRMMKDIVCSVYQLFGKWRGLQSAFQIISTPGYCPELLTQYINDQPYVSAKLFAQELTKINCSYRGKFVPLEVDVVEMISSQWMISVCNAANETIHEMCSCFERTEQLLEFGVAINKVFKTDCTATFSNTAVYRNLFGQSLLECWHRLIVKELKELEEELLSKLSSVNCNPPPLFHKRASKFNTSLASGVSQDLHLLVQKFFDQLRNLMQRVAKYVQIGYENDVHILRTYLADSVLELVKRLTENQIFIKTNTDGENLLPSEKNMRWLKKFRLYLALVQYEPSVISHCMFDETEKAVQGNCLLRNAAEKALCKIIDYVVDEAIQEENLQAFPVKCALAKNCLDYVQVPGKIILDSITGSTADIPTQLSKPPFNFLYTICRRISQDSYAHLFTRNVSVHVLERLSNILSENLRQCADQVPKNSVFAIQLVLDCRILYQMFPHPVFMDAVNTLRLKIDPMEWSLLDNHLATNARRAVQRCSMLFGQLQVEDVSYTSLKQAESMNIATENNESINTTNEAENNTIVAPLVDILPRIEGVARLSTIPRLTSLRSDEKTQQRREIEAQSKDATKRLDPKNLNFSVDSIFGYFMHSKNN